MKRLVSSIPGTLLLAAMLLSPAGCARRMTVSTGTTIGLHATPGDGKSQSPQVTLAYKRSEIALVPTGEKPAKKKQNGNSDSYSSLAVIDFQTKWFGSTSIDQFIATGHASRDIQHEGSAFTETLARGGGIRDDVVEANVYRALAGVTNDLEAVALIRGMDALGALEPDEYTYIAIPPNPPVTFKREFVRRTGPANYDSFKKYRARLKGSINHLKSAATVKVTEVDGSASTFTGDTLKAELKKYEEALLTLQRNVARTGAPRRALNYYVETLYR